MRKENRKLAHGTNAISAILAQKGLQLLLQLLLLFLFKPTSTKPQAGKLVHIQNYGCNGNLLCDHGVVERNRISSLESHEKALKKECFLPGVFCDSGDRPMPANLLCELNGHLIPHTSCLYGKWVDVCAGQFAVFVYLILCCFVGCCTWLSCCAANMGLSICVWCGHVPGHWLISSGSWQNLQKGALLRHNGNKTELYSSIHTHTRRYIQSWRLHSFVCDILYAYSFSLTCLVSLFLCSVS